MFELLGIAALCITDYRAVGFLKDIHPRAFRDMGEIDIRFDYYPASQAVLPR